MAEEENNSDEAPAKKKFPVKVLIILAIVVVVQGAIFGAGYFVFGDKPPTVEAQGLDIDDKAAEFELVEILLIGGKFQNTRQGAQAYLYDATIYVVVQERHRVHVEAVIGEQEARISEEIVEVFARAEPAQLNEPGLLTLKRQILSKCKERFGEDADKELYVRDVVISNWKRFSTDS